MTKVQEEHYLALKRELDDLTTQKNKFREVQECLDYDTWGYKRFVLHCEVHESNDGNHDDGIAKNCNISLSEKEVSAFMKAFTAGIDNEIKSIQDKILEI